ncbi:hypothetical protein [Nonomuraea sp. SBT364]|uniref:hypothetical protein n=1 Tax=Nonomuraea sp. SBT364 TaxID=1580530 RepID=UPI00066ABF5D|nr:hypothetical protein [Nonomuraea sp. SBT364]
MSKLKTMMAAATLTTALTGGMVGVGEAASATTTNASTSVGTATNVSNYVAHPRWCRWHRGHRWGHGWGHGHGWGWGHHGRRHGHGRYVNRVKVFLNLAEDRVRSVHRRGCLKIRHNNGGHW